MEDYRAGASVDLVHDAEKDGSTVTCPILVLHSQHLSRRFDVRAIWQAENIDKNKLEVAAVGDEGTGHFIPIEAVAECASCLGPWLDHQAQS